MHYRKCIFDSVEDTSSTKQVVRSVLLANKIDICSLPSYLFKSLPGDAKYVTAETVCKSLKNVQRRMDLTDGNRIDLLAYLLGGLNNPAHLIGLDLPLTCAKWIEFKPASSPDKIYISSTSHHRNLLPGLEYLFLDVVSVPEMFTKSASKGQQLDQHITESKFFNN